MKTEETEILLLSSKGLDLVALLNLYLRNKRTMQTVFIYCEQLAANWNRMWLNLINIGGLKTMCYSSCETVPGDLYGI